MKKLATALAVVIMAVVCLPFPLGAAEGKSYTLAVPAQLAPLEMHKSWAPLVDALSKELRAPIRLKVYETLPQYFDDVGKGIPDFAFLNPYLTVAQKKHKYIPLVRDSNPLVGILVVRKESPVKSVHDLKGKEIAFPTPNAYAASLYLRALLREKEKIDFTPVYAATHSNVYRSVIMGRTSGGGGVNKSLSKEPEEVQSQLRILYRTPASAPHPLSAHPRVPKKLRQAMTEAVLRLASAKGNKDMFRKIQMPDPVKADYAKDYAPLEKLGLEKYFVSGEE